MTTPLIPVSFGLCLLCTSASAQWSTDTLPVPRHHLAPTATDDQIWFGGGLTLSQGVHDAVEVFDARTGAWTSVKLSQARQSLAAAAAGGKVVFAGGWAGFESDRVDVFDAQTLVRTTTTLPIPTSNCVGIGMGSKVFIAGGAVPTGTGGLSVVQIYDVVTETWSIADVLPGEVWNLQAARDGDLLFFGCGVSYHKAPKESLTIYDGQTDTWSVIRTPHVNEAMQLAALDGRVYLGGGVLDFDKVVNGLLDVYDVTNDQWHTSRLPTDRGHCSEVAVLAPFLIFSGGWSISEQRFLDTADVLNTVTGDWRSLPISVDAVGRGAASLPQHRLAMFAGGYCCGDQNQSISTIDVFSYDDLVGDSYCAPANLNSTGQSGRIRAYGNDLAADGFVNLEAWNLPPGRWGLFLVGSEQTFVPNPGGSQGNLCLGGSMARYGKEPRYSGPDGRFGLWAELTPIPTKPAHHLAPGETWRFQAWYRDQNPSATSNFTDALAVTYQ